jgi:predicted transcriptional regulator
MVTIVDVYETTESAVGPEGTIHATLAPSPVEPNRLVGGPVRLRTDQWQMIYDASQAAGWQFSRPLIEKAIKQTGVTITNLNAVYTKLYRWMEDMQLIINTKPGDKNPAYRLTPKGRYVVESYTKGVNIQNEGGRLRVDTSEVQ